MKVEVKSSELKVGDILEIGVGDNLPADCLFLAST
jgi:magnesium-transporting ATPase (P-type)